ncbi:NfeD family protein [Burkholderia cenocepacia]|uniref:NfeD family protein n=1 Tax=Burkholderia cenocepacia TaxID=95486 RepID=UPI0012375221|nr:NfeD family protein [Burkholderia cenocepacia]
MTLSLLLLIGAVLLVVVELHTSTLHAAGMAVGLLVAAAISHFAPQSSHLVLAGVFVPVSAGFYILLRTFIKPAAPVVMAESIGRSATVARVGKDGAVRVTYRGAEWDADVVKDEDVFLKEGDVVKIQGVAGIRLVVKSIA